MAGFVFKFVIISTIATILNAMPSCQFNKEFKTELVCTPGDDDYVLSRRLVSDNNATTKITLRACRITAMELESFENLFNLQYLDVSMNKIQSLELGVLDGALEVTHLNLSYNNLTDFVLGLFDEKPNLEVLDLKGNRINSLQLGLFDELPKLKHVDLSDNSILGKDFNAYIFDRSTQIQHIDFSRNNMNGASDELLHAFRALDFLNLNRCSLTEVPKFATSANLKTMKHLMISENQISKVDNPDIFQNLENLEILNFADNIIENLHENVFKTLKRLKVITLRQNRLKSLPDTLFQNMVKLNNIDLSHNLIEFVPVNAFRGTSVKNLNLADNRFTYLTDNICLELRNSGASVTKFFFNQNPWQCACLREILNEVKSLGVVYNSVKFNGKEPVCVTTSEFYCKRHQNFNRVYLEMYYNLIH